jgi:glycosyltransferase involved in cell wall biosynthesis
LINTSGINLKIIHITPSYKPAYIYGGPIQSVAKLCEALVGLGTDDVQVLTTTANGTTELDVKIGRPVLVEGVKVSYFKRWTKDHSHFSPGLLWSLRKEILHYIQHNKPINTKPVVHIHAWWNLVSLLSCYVAKWYKVPVVLSPRGMLTAYTQNNRNSSFKKLLHNIIGKKLLQYCHVHATSEQEKRDILEIITPKSITVIPNLANLTSEASSIKYQISGIKYQVPSIKYQVPGIKYQVLRRDNFKPSFFKLIFLSRIEEKKGLELLFDALSLLDIDWQLIIAGSGKEGYVESLKLKAEHLQLNQRINWIGQITDQDKYSLMAEQDLLVLSSYNENFANVVIESLSVGTPVLVSDQVGLSDYINEQQLGWICKLDVNDIKTQLLLAFHGQEKRENIKQLAPKIIKRDFDDQVLAKRYLELYEKLAQ